jgi:cysteine synthase
MIGAIGNTPLVRLPSEEGGAEIWAKWEGGNPTGSMKDRMALSIVRGAIQRGELKPGGTVCDYNGGSTGSSVAMVCAALGYGAHFVSSDAFDESKIQTMRAFGARVDVIPSEGRQITPELFERCFARVAELKSQPDYFVIDQFNNVDNRAGYLPMGEEILAQLDGPVDAFVAGIGTGGCFSGNAEVLKAANSATLCVAVEPANSRPLAGLAPTGPHRLEGMGVGFVTGIMRVDLVDETIAVTDDEAKGAARELATRSGVFAGLSSGANVFAARQIAAKLGPGKKVVTVLCDSGLRYLQGDLYST